MSLTTTTENPRYQFDQATNTVFLGKTETGSVCYTGHASKDWAIGNVPNVSYVVSLILDSVLQNYQQRHQKHPVALNCYFFGKTLPGAFIVEIEELKSSGKGYCICRAVLKQYKDMDQPLPSTIADYKSNDPITKVHGIFTMGNMDTESGKTHYHNNPKAPSRDKMIPTKYAFMGNFSMHKWILRHSLAPAKPNNPFFRGPSMVWMPKTWCFKANLNCHNACPSLMGARWT
ncbi:unnamed protein product [Absidia cylindrospora]